MRFGDSQAGAPETMSDTAPIEHPSWLTGGDFTAADEHLRLFAAWLSEATASEPRDPTAMTLATIDADGQPKRTGIGRPPPGGAGLSLEIAQPAGPRARKRGARQRGRGRRLFRHPGEAGANR